MIIDEHADFRSLLMHHVTSHWPDAIISAYDPTAAGHLPDEFGGAGNDVVLLGSRHGEDRDGVEVLARFLKRNIFPPVIYFGTEQDQADADELRPDSHFMRTQVNHDLLIAAINDVLQAKPAASSSGMLFVGDAKYELEPISKGYRLIRKLGSTEHSAVYLAERESTQQLVVLKVLRQLPGHDDGIAAIERFVQEYETIADMHHQNVVKIYDLSVSDDYTHIAMEYLDGGDLRNQLEIGVGHRDAVRFLLQIASALSAVHSENVLHRDLKPGNIMLRKNGSIALIDFGLAKRAKLEAAITDKGEIFGTPYYMSPEQGHGAAVDERSDIYSLGVIFFELLTGKKPFVGDSAMGIIYKHAHAPIPLLPPRLAEYQSLLNMMLAKRPEDRLQSAAEIKEWL